MSRSFKVDHEVDINGINGLKIEKISIYKIPPDLPPSANLGQVC